MVFALMLPFLTDFAREIQMDADSKKMLIFCLLSFLLSGKTIASVLGFISIVITVNDSASLPAALTSVHAFAQVFSSFARAVGPAVSGSCWSWSLRNDIGLPFDFHFTFFLIAILSFGSYILTMVIRPAIDADLEDKT
jgi:hypothetical protein